MKEIKDFFNSKHFKSGNDAQCKYCRTEYQRNNRDSLLQYKKEYYLRNKKIQLQSQKNKYEENIEYSRIKSREYLALNKERINKKRRIRNSTPQEKIKIFERLKAYRLTENGRLSNLNYRHKRRSIVKNTNTIILNKLVEVVEDSKKCYWCGLEFNGGIKKSIDHFIPLSRGGTHSLDNIVISCISCNCKKSNKMPEEFLLLLDS